jgi:hypothetical protein
LASSSTVLRHVFFGLPLPRLPWGFIRWFSQCMAQPSPLAFPDLQKNCLH